MQDVKDLGIGIDMYGGKHCNKNSMHLGVGKATWTCKTYVWTEVVGKTRQSVGLTRQGCRLDDGNAKTFT